MRLLRKCAKKESHAREILFYFMLRYTVLPVSRADNPFSLFYCHDLRKIPRLIHVKSLVGGNVIRQELQGH